MSKAAVDQDLEFDTWEVVCVCVCVSVRWLLLALCHYMTKTLRSICVSSVSRSKMSRELENNLTQLYDNWTIYNSSESVPPRTNITFVGFYLHQPSTAAIFIVSYLLIFVVCMVGNGVVCFIVLRSKNMWTVTNLFILNLAVSDLLVGIFCMPTTLLDNIITGEQNNKTLYDMLQYFLPNSEFWEYGYYLECHVKSWVQK